ncbi:MAG: hypothetical protein A4E65_03802 [Syntrophorhabdus sp. PtaU1.Bin153]|nr:MAG: hypothetical protein A4E65_03802 [Syntrophorhabdus sp. PtaU1.Bin153]
MSAQDDDTKSDRVNSREGEKLYRHCLERIGSGEITPNTAIGELSDALSLGLCLKDTVEAHVVLGNQWSELDNDHEATLQYDCALELVQKYRSELDADALSILWRNICARYIAQARRIRSREGLDNCFVYLEAKQGLLNDWASPRLYVELGNVYDEKNPFDFDKTAFYYAKATECAVLGEDDGVAVQTAREALRILERQRAYFAARKFIPGIGALPKREGHRKLALISSLGVFLLGAGYLASSYIRIDALHYPLVQKAAIPSDNQQPGKQRQPEPAKVEPEPAKVGPEVTPSATRTEGLRNIKTVRGGTARRTAKQETQGVRRTVTLKRARRFVNTTAQPKDVEPQKKSFMPPSREDL